MSYQENINHIHQFVSELNQGNLESVQKYIAPDFFNYSPGPDEPSATEVFYSLLSDLKGAMSNLYLAVENLGPEGDLLKGRMTVEGTHDGPLWGAPASSTAVSWSVDIVLRPIDSRFALTLKNFTMPEIITNLRKMEVVPERPDLRSKHPVAIPEIILKAIFTGQVAQKPCSHMDAIKVTETETDVCELCVASGDIWPALRMCLICGYVGCCDAAKNKHMKQHYEKTGHMLFRSIHREEGWVWCYEDNAFFSKRILENK